jgi:hypothetical protein
VPQVQAVRNHRPDRLGVLPSGHGELTDRQVLHHRSAHATQLHQPGRPRHSRLPTVTRLVRVQVCPMQRKLQLTHLSRTPVPNRRLHRGQRLGSVEILDGDEAGGLGHDSIPALATDSHLPSADVIHRVGDDTIPAGSFAAERRPSGMTGG